MRTARSPGAVAAHGASENDPLGSRVTSETNFPSHRAQAIRARLVGSNCCEAGGIVAHDSAPALALCRELIAAGADPSAPLHCYRDGVLALKVRCLREGARLKINSKGTAFVARRAVRTASASPKNKRGVPTLADTPSIAPEG
jgi:hypothetical protein